MLPLLTLRGRHPPTREENETPSEVTVSLRVASLLLRLCCGLWSREDRGRPCQLGVEQEQQGFVVRERHPVSLPGVAPNLCGESDVVGGPGDESAVAGERLVHDLLATEGRNGRLESGKLTPRPLLRQPVLPHPELVDEHGDCRRAVLVVADALREDAHVLRTQ